ncbi:MAG TPA: glycosyltransferase family 2 protein [Thermoanaerobaculia bacterium]|nr:glycosyltransferase family 2 protein [Thermoanaerobaculia bacterium]
MNPDISQAQGSQGPGFPRVSAIVPAFNEEETLADVLAVLKETSLVDEVLVVSDGSTDGTVEIARAMGVRTIHLRRNHGKGMALAMGVVHSSAPILVFVDGDIMNLSEYLLGQLIDPVVSGHAAMCVGIRYRGWLLDLLHARFGPLLSGIRCLERRVFDALPESYVEGFAVETALNYACRRQGLPVETTVLHELKHRVKEQKRGLQAGARARLEMFGAVFSAWLRLHWDRPVLRPGNGDRTLQAGLDYVSW